VDAADKRRDNKGQEKKLRIAPVNLCWPSQARCCCRSRGAATPDGKGFPSADAAAQALVSAARADDVAGVIEILGPSAKSIAASHNSVADRKRRHDFAACAAQNMRLIASPGKQNAKTLLVGRDERPLPSPIVEMNGQWYFDTRGASKRSLTGALAATN
jgi:hypothetical protein